MKIFVSSRMAELFIERKTAIEVVHFSGHTPLYIETEPMVKDRQARDVMVSLLNDADAFLSIHYLSEGQQNEDVLDNYTPIQFELVQFMELHPHKPVLLFKRSPDAEVAASLNMTRFFRQKAETLRSEIVEFRTPSDLHERLLKALSHYKSRIDSTKAHEVLVLRYLGPDFIGLVGQVSEVLFTKYRLNIDYISHASHFGVATLCLSCSPRDADVKLTDNYNELVRHDIASRINEAIPGYRKNVKQSITPFNLTVDTRRATAKPPQFYVEIRTIDAPGQLNAICKVLRERRFNIDHLQQRPTAPEYSRQATSVWWLSKPGSRAKHQREDLASIEGALQYLVGVRSFSIKVLQ